MHDESNEALSPEGRSKGPNNRMRSSSDFMNSNQSSCGVKIEKQESKPS